MEPCSEFSRRLQRAVLTGLCFLSMATSTLVNGADTQNNAEPQSTPPASQEVLKRWGNRVRSKMGPLVTPPAGKIDSSVQAAREEIQEILNNLFGSSKLQSDFHLVVNLYDSKVINAFMAKAEHFYKRKNQEDYPIVRRFLGNSSDGKPIYELAVSTKLMKTATTQDELAFVLGHEMAHLFQGHVEAVHPDHAEQLTRWWSSQQFEAVADYESLKAMKGKYDLGAAVQIMNKLFPVGQASTRRTFMAAAESHHHEGVRLSLLQGEIETFRQTDGDAQPRLRVPLKSGANLRTYGRERNLSVSEKKASFFNTFRELQKSSATKQAKIDRLLDLFSQPKFDLWSHFSEDESRQITRFMAENAVGPDRWKASQFYADQRPPNGSILILDLFLGPNQTLGKSQRLQAEMLKLTQTVPEWRALFDQLPSEVARPEHNELHVLLVRIATMFRDEDPLAKPLKGSFLKYIRSKDWATLASMETDRGFPLTKLEDRIAWAEHPPDYDAHLYIDSRFVAETKQAIAAGTAVLERDFLPRTLPILTNVVESAENRDLALSRLVEFCKRHPLKTKDQPKVFKALALAARDFNNTTFTPYARGDKEKSEFLDLVSQALESNALSREEKHQLFTFSIGHSLGELNNKEDATNKRLMTYLEREWDHDSFMDLMQRTYLPSEEIVLHPIVQEIESGSASTIDSLMDLNNRISNLTEIQRGRKNMLLALAGGDPDFRSQYMRNFSFKDLQMILDDYHAFLESKWNLQSRAARRQIPRFADQHVGTSGTSTLMELLLESQDQAPSFEAWKKAYLGIHELSPIVLEIKQGYAGEIESYLERKWFPRMSIGQIIETLKNPKIRKAFSAKTIAGYLTQYSKGKLGGKLGDPKIARSVIASVEHDFDLEKDAPEVRAIYRNQLLEDLNAQPKDVEILFPKINGHLSTTEATSAAATPIRGLSAIVAATRPESPANQIQMIEYLMGRTDEVPAFYERIADKAGVDTPLVSLLRIARERIRRGDLKERVLVANSFLAGPNGMVNSKDGLEALISHLLKQVPPDQVPVARLVGDSLLAANGEQRSLALAYLLGQPLRTGQAALELNDLVASGLLAHGVPGIKFGQYLGFTETFKHLGSALEDFQDHAAPMEYADILDMLREANGGTWPDHLQVKGAVGFGSVNVAVELHNTQTGQAEVVSMLRPHVEAATVENFRKFNLFLEELAKRSTTSIDFSFLRGLSTLVQKSVTLEFDKQAALRMQQQVYPRYSAEVDGWKVGSVEAFRMENRGVFMRKAEGVTAKTLARQNPAAYRQAMKILSETEMDILLGIDKDGNPSPVPLHANPDFHDGQVIIDLKNKKIQILDFGQAVSITNEERLEALDFLRVISKSENPKSAVAIINKAAGRDVLTLSEMKALLAGSDDSMGLFVKLLSKLNLKGYEMPLSEVHWIFAANRQIALGKKIGVSNYAVFRNLIVSRKLGLDQTAFNKARLGVRAVKKDFGNAVQSMRQSVGQCILNYVSKIEH